MSTGTSVFPKISVGAGFNRPSWAAYPHSRAPGRAPANCQKKTVRGEIVISSSSRLKSQVFHHVGTTQLNFGEELLFGCFEYHTVY